MIAVKRTPLWPDPRVKPPFGAAEIDWGHPLARGLETLWLMNEGAGIPTPLPFRSTVPTGVAGWTGNPAGLARRYGVITGYDTTNTALPNLGGAVTVAMIRRKLDTTLRAAAHFASNDDASHRVLALAPFSDGTVYWDHGTGVGAGQRLMWAGYTPTTETESWVFVAGPSGMAIYLNGQVGASDATASSFGAGAYTFSINHWSVGVDGDLVEVNHLGVFNGVEWTASDVLRWYEAPYAFLRPIIRRRYFVPAVGSPFPPVPAVALNLLLRL